MDKSFTSFQLLEFLTTINTRASGNMWENKLGDCKISRKKAIDKFERGAIDYWISV